MDNLKADTLWKVLLWESAKGKLRALVQIQGSYSDDLVQKEKQSMLMQEVEEFIQTVEANGLHE